MSDEILKDLELLYNLIEEKLSAAESDYFNCKIEEFKQLLNSNKEG